jgi:hypothetical protein
MAETVELPESFLEVPELDVLVLDAPAVQRVFQELAFETTVLGVLVKGATSDRAKAPAPSLGTAREILLGGEATGLQIHYVHGGAEWWTTLMRTAVGVRFVRVRKSASSEP